MCSEACLPSYAKENVPSLAQVCSSSRSFITLHQVLIIMLYFSLLHIWTVYYIIFSLGLYISSPHRPAPPTPFSLVLSSQSFPPSHAVSPYTFPVCVGCSLGPVCWILLGLPFLALLGWSSFLALLYSCTVSPLHTYKFGSTRVSLDTQLTQLAI